MKSIAMQEIGHICSDFPTKFGIPRQSGLVEELEAAIVFEPEFRNPDALRGLEVCISQVSQFRQFDLYSSDNKQQLNLACGSNDVR